MKKVSNETEIIVDSRHRPQDAGEMKITKNMKWRKEKGGETENK